MSLSSQRDMQIQKGPVQKDHSTLVMSGGLGRNRTTDTRIFRTGGSQNVNVYSACSPKLCYVLHSVLQQKQRILSIS